jgi:phenylalanyl-tRNA synthetase beta chain
MSVMRSSLLGSLLQVLRFNLDRKAERLRVFELGRVFLRDAAVDTTDSTVRGVRQPMRVAGLAYGDPDGLQWGHKTGGADFFDVKGDVDALLSPHEVEYRRDQHPAMHPGRCASIRLDGEAIGHVGELHPRWRQSWEFAQAPLVFELDLDAVCRRPVPAFQPVPRYQPAERDIAVIVADDVSHADLMAAVHAADTGGLLQHAFLFDVYRPQQPGAGFAAGEKSMAVRLTLASREATLTDEQIDGAVRAVIDHITARLGGRLRS